MHFDPLTAKYLLVRQHDSWLSVDPVVGCAYDCAYCILKIDRLTATRPTTVASRDDAIHALVSHPNFMRNSTVVSYGNNTDAFLPQNIAATLAFIEEFRAQGYQNPIAIATKAVIDSATAVGLRRAGGVRLIILLSYSGLERLEKGVHHQGLKRNFEILSSAGVTLLHYWRPLVLANGTGAKLEEVLRLVSRFARASVCIGLKYSPRLYDILAEKRELRLSESLRGKAGNHLDESLLAVLRELVGRLCPQYPIYFRTSCAVASVISGIDYTATYDTDACRMSNCPADQRARCRSSHRLPSPQDVDRALARLGLLVPYRLTTSALEFEGTLSQPDYVFLLHNLRCMIRARVSQTTEWAGHILPENTD